MPLGHFWVFQKNGTRAVGDSVQGAELNPRLVTVSRRQWSSEQAGERAARRPSPHLEGAGGSNHGARDTESRQLVGEVGQMLAARWCGDLLHTGVGGRVPLRTGPGDGVFCSAGLCEHSQKFSIRHTLHALLLPRLSN